MVPNGSSETENKVRNCCQHARRPLICQESKASQKPEKRPPISLEGHFNSWPPSVCFETPANSQKCMRRAPTTGPFLGLLRRKMKCKCRAVGGYSIKHEDAVASYCTSGRSEPRVPQVYATGMSTPECLTGDFYCCSALSDSADWSMALRPVIESMWMRKKSGEIEWSPNLSWRSPNGFCHHWRRFLRDSAHVPALRYIGTQAIPGSVHLQSRSSIETGS